MNNNSKWKKLLDQVTKLNFFDKINILYVILFLLIAIIFPFGVIKTLWWDGAKMNIRLFNIDFWKTDIVLLFILAIEILISVHHKFKRFYLNFTGISSDIYARFILKFFMFGMFIIIGDLILYYKINISQSIWFWLGYYLLGIIVIGWLIVDYLFLQRKYKLNKRYKDMQVGIDHTSSEEKEHDKFSGLFDQE